MKTNHHRQGRTGAGERELKRAHARRLLLTLADICSRLRSQLTNQVVHRQYQAVERMLRRLARGE